MQNDAGEQKTFYVTRIENGRLTVDGNHPLAGRALNVRLKIHEVRDATPEDALNTGIHAVSRMMKLTGRIASQTALPPTLAPARPGGSGFLIAIRPGGDELKNAAARTLQSHASSQGPTRHAPRHRDPRRGSGHPHEVCDPQGAAPARRAASARARPRHSRRARPGPGRGGLRPRRRAGFRRSSRSATTSSGPSRPPSWAPATRCSRRSRTSMTATACWCCTVTSPWSSPTPCAPCSHARAGGAAHRAAARPDGLRAHRPGLGRDSAPHRRAEGRERAQRAIDEVNTGIMALDGARLARWLGRLENANAQGEYYLTDVVGLAVGEGLPVEA